MRHLKDGGLLDVLAFCSQGCDEGAGLGVTHVFHPGDSAVSHLLRDVEAPAEGSAERHGTREAETGELSESISPEERSE